MRIDRRAAVALTILTAVATAGVTGHAQTGAGAQDPMVDQGLDQGDEAARQPR